MSDSNLNSFVNSCSGYVVSYILTPIVSHLNEKGVDVSLEELVNVLQLPATRPAVAAMAMAPVPSMAFGGAVPSVSTSGAGGRKQTATSSVQSGLCAYQYRRGENKGRFCGKPTINNADYCVSCTKSRKNLEKDRPSGSLPGSAPGVGAIPGIPSGYNGPVPASNGDSSGRGQLSVLPFDDNLGLLREPLHGFILRDAGKGQVFVIGKCVDLVSKEVISLTLQDREIAEHMGLRLTDQPPTNHTTSIPSSVQVPSFTGSSAIPTIPSIPGIPSIPSIPMR